jgi:hypothetical protein
MHEVRWRRRTGTFRWQLEGGDEGTLQGYSQQPKPRFDASERERDRGKHLPEALRPPLTRELLDAVVGEEREGERERARSEAVGSGL